MVFILDTNIIWHYLKKDEVMKVVEKMFDPFNPEFTVIISIVTAAELYALAAKNNWGSKRKNALTNFLDALVIIDISDWRLVQY